MKVQFSGILGTEADDVFVTLEVDGVPRVGDQVQFPDGLTVQVVTCCWVFEDTDTYAVVRVR